MNNQDIAIFSYIFTEIESPFLDSVGQLVTALISYAAAPLQVALVIYIALTGILMMRGHAGEVMGGLLGRVIKLCIVVWFMTNGSVYTTYVQDFALSVLPNDISKAISSAGNSGTTIDANSFDVIWQQSYDAGLRVWRLLDAWDVGEEGTVLLFWLAAMVTCLVTFSIWFLSHVALGLFIILGPLLLPLVLFPATKAIFERWVGSMISCVILQVITVVMVTLILAVESRLMLKITTYTGNNPFVQIRTLFAGVIFFGFSGVIAFQLPGFATALAGGLHFHTGAIARAMSGTARRGASTAKQGAGLAGRAAGRAAGAGVRAVRERIRPSTGGSLSSSSTPRT